MDQKNELRDLYARYQEDSRFDKLRRIYGINFVPGDGPIHPDIMLVGEAPGKYENMKKRPFVGPSSKVLEKILKKVNLDIENIFFTNVVKYWPRSSEGRAEPLVNRTVTDQELEAAKEYLLREIEIIDPLIVGLCGIKAIRTFFPGISDVYTCNGQLLDDKFVALYHPGLVHHDNSKSQAVEDGFADLKHFIDDELKAS